MYNKKQIIWVDIGSHFGQEYNLFFLVIFIFIGKSLEGLLLVSFLLRVIFMDLTIY